MGENQSIPDIKLDLHGIKVVVPDYTKSDLPDAYQEAAALIGSKAGSALKVDDFYDFLGSSDSKDHTGVLHFVGHGYSNSKLHRIAFLDLGPNPQKQEMFFDVNMARMPATNRLGQKSQKPFAFFNACTTAAVGNPQALGSLSCWASVLIQQGYCGYIGTLWPVDDEHASIVSTEIYADGFEPGKSIPMGEVMRRIRKKFVNSTKSNPESAVRLAYVYYGHPNGVINAIK